MRQIRQVHKKSTAAFGIVVGNTIKRYVDPRGIRTSDPDAGVPDAISCIGMHDDGGCLIEQEGQVLTEVLPLNSGFADSGLGEGCGATGPHGTDFHR